MRIWWCQQLKLLEFLFGTNYGVMHFYVCVSCHLILLTDLWSIVITPVLLMKRLEFKKFNLLKATQFGQGWFWNSQQYFQHFATQECLVWFSSFQFSHSVVSNSLRPHEPQLAKPPCPSTTPGVYPNSCPLSRWCHLTISSSVIPFSSCLQSFPTSGSFQMSQLFASCGQNTGVSALTSVLPMNTQDHN